MNMEKQYKYFAFISYSNHDMAWGKRLQRKLEGYRMPATLCSEYGWKRKPLNPVFFAPADIQPGDLSQELQERLRDSKNLIVICSSHSARSEWVGKEIAFFHSLGRADNIYFFIVDGIPNSGDPETECFNPVIKSLGLPEILGANVNEKIYRLPWLNRERAYVQLITKLLGVEFDCLWQRHRRLQRRKIAALTCSCIAIVAALIAVWIHNRPVDVHVALNESSIHNANLPPLKDAIVSLALENEIKTDTVSSIDSKAVFANLPAYALGKTVHLKVTGRDWMPVDTTFTLSRNIIVNMQRDPNCYGNVEFRLWSRRNERGVANVRVYIEGLKAISDQEGRIRLFIPLGKQNSQYKVISKLPLEDNILSMPTTPSRVLRIMD